MVWCPVATIGMNAASGWSRHQFTSPAPGVRLVFAGPQGRLAPVVQTSTCLLAQRNTVVRIAASVGMLVPNAALTAGTRLSGIGRGVLSLPIRAQAAAGCA